MCWAMIIHQVKERKYLSSLFTSQVCQWQQAPCYIILSKQHITDQPENKKYESSFILPARSVWPDCGDIFQLSTRLSIKSLYKIQRLLDSKCQSFLTKTLHTSMTRPSLCLLSITLIVIEKQPTWSILYFLFDIPPHSLKILSLFSN